MKRIFLFLLMALTLAGCAVTSRYVTYTGQKFPAKTKYYFVTIYYEGQRPPADLAYQVIGRAEVSGYESAGVDQDALLDQAKNIARNKGADAIMNVRITAVRYGGVYVEPGYRSWHYYHPAEYFPYSDVKLMLKGELIVFSPKPFEEKE